MQVSVEVGEGLERRLKVELPFAQLTAEVDKQLQKLARTATLPGFRAGRVPMKLLQKRFLERVRMDVFGDLVQSSYGEALKQEALIPAGLPTIEPEIDFAAERIGYTATLEIMPEFELVSLADKTLKRPVCELTDADLETMLAQLRKQRGTWNAVERPCQMGDRLTIDFISRVSNEEKDETETDFKLELGANTIMAGFDDGLIGASVGEQRQLDLHYSDDNDVEIAGRAVTYTVTVKAIEELFIPEIDAEFIAAFGIDDGDIERFRADVRTNMERELTQRLASRLKTAVMTLLFDANPIVLPRTLVNEEIEEIREKLSKDVGFAVNFPTSLFEDEAQRRVALGLIFSKFVTQHELKISPAQIREKVEQIASTYEHPQAVIDHYYGDRKYLRTVESVLLEDAIVDLVLEQAQVEDEAICFADLTAASR